MATPEQNLVTSRRWLLEVFNERQLDAVPDIIADDYRNFGTTDATGIEAGRQVITQADGWAPDHRISIKYQAAQDDVVLLLFSVEGTHKGLLAELRTVQTNFSFRSDECQLSRVKRT